ncbi:MAG: helix-turn-helix transcriptional regulator [Lachnospiraceae bacterium]|nr:helix-turn-helix transcriptional regulator [Lachnospiraceae bacterium]
MIKSEEMQIKRQNLLKIGEQIRNAREKCSFDGTVLTQKEAAELMGVSNIYLSQVENGLKMPSLFFLIRFSAIFYADLNVLLAPVIECYRREAAGVVEWQVQILKKGERGLYRRGRRCTNEYTH